MKNICKFLVLSLLLNCSPTRSTTFSFDGVYVFRKKQSNPITDECKIILSKNYRFKYICLYNHLGTAIEGNWELFSNDRIIIRVDKEDVFPAYPEKFYSKVDTIYILNDSCIMNNSKVFFRDKYLIK